MHSGFDLFQIFPCLLSLRGFSFPSLVVVDEVITYSRGLLSLTGLPSPRLGNPPTRAAKSPQSDAEWFLLYF